MEVDVAGRLSVRTRIDAEHVHHLHQVEYLVPTLLVEAVLQRVAGRVAASAVLPHQRLHAVVIGRVARERGQELVARQLADPIFLTGHRLQPEILLRRLAQVDIALGRLIGESLRPHAVFAIRQRREVVAAGLIGVD